MTRSRRRPGSAWTRGAVVVSVLAAAGCGFGEGAVPVQEASAAPAAARACRALVDDLPDTVSGELRRSVDPDDAVAAAWGDPPIVLTCGGDWQLPRRASCQEVNGIGWYAPEEAFTDQSIDVELTTLDRRPRVRVEVPADYRPPAGVMVDLAEAIAAHTRGTGECR